MLPSGRLALYYALKLLGINQDDEVLVPAYHCGTMLEPVIVLGARLTFFNLDKSLNVDLDHLTSAISDATKAVIAPHFFGFPQNLEPVHALCKKKGITLIEDCAHALWGRSKTVRHGDTGDFSLTSTVKFFPGIEGGALICNNPNLSLNDIPLKNPGLKRELQALIHPLQLLFQYKRAWRSRRKLSSQTFTSFTDKQIKASFRPLKKADLRWFDVSQIGYQPTRMTRLLIQHTSWQNIIQKRIANYHYYHKHLVKTQNAITLHGHLPEGVVPYAFPLLLQRPERDFPLLKRLGVPMWRWEELAVTDCPVSMDYRLRLIQLPCHHSLRARELDWILATLKDVLTRP